jgi:two-component system CheB/CheR fusion protein
VEAGGDMAKNKTVKAVKAKNNNDFPIVGIGASAGGLEAMESLFSNFPAEPGLGFVIIQHLDPKHRSIMVSLLQKHTKMNVVEVEDGMRVEANCVYLNPPNKDVTIEKRILRLEEPILPTRGIRLPIDHFLRSLAADLKEKAVCIILSGTGSDGSLGLKAVKGEGGITLAQATEQAKYAGMPQSAIDTGFVDLILPVEKILRELLKYARHPYLKKLGKKPSETQRFAEAADRIFAVIRESTGVDFARYKQNTVRRRIERRMAIHHIDKPEDYVRYVRENTSEVDLLYKDLLIKVTSFFRDSEAFKVLEEEVVPQILKHKMPGSSIRIWVPACATGEEAYSIAMLFVEAMDSIRKHFDVHIFATDIDLEAINTARQAGYADNIAADVSAERLDRFFTRTEGGYRVKKSLREIVVFAAQNIIKDPPFSKIDLVSCRNMLIYMDASLQNKLLPLFHYVLNPEGYLLLGSSETVGRFADLFSPVNLKWKIFRRKSGAAGHRFDLGKSAAAAVIEPVKAGPEPAVAEQAVRKLAETIILENYAPTCVLVNKKYDILYVNGRTDQFLALPAGEPTYNVLKMARDEVRFKLSTVLHKAFKEKKEARAQGLPVKIDGSISTFNLIVRPVAVAGSEGELAMVIFEIKKPSARPAAEPKKKAGRMPAATNARVQELEGELASTREYLQTTVEELETANEELKSTNEELQSTNEELQSSNEELETSREELQSTNEELETVNTELQNKIAEMSEASGDFSNLLNSLDIAALFLDSRLRTRRFSAAAGQLFNLISTDVGRPVEDISHKLKRPSLFEDIRGVLESLVPVEEETETLDGRWFFMRIRPYRTLENVVDGAVLTFVDITARKKAELAAEAIRHFAESIIDTIREPLLVLDEKLSVVSANQSFYHFFQVNQEDTVGRFIYDLGSGQWNIPRLKQLLEDILPRNNKFENFEVEHDFPVIGKKRMLLNARQIFEERKGRQQILLAFEDVTGRTK